MADSIGPLAQQSCADITIGSSPLPPSECETLLQQLTGWEIKDRTRLWKRYDQPDFVQALALTNGFGGIAEQEGHHPDITVGWGKTIVEMWTHDVGGLSIYDFIVAAKLDAFAEAWSHQT